jgi:hypothetical protein
MALPPSQTPPPPPAPLPDGYVCRRVFVSVDTATHEGPIVIRHD